MYQPEDICTHGERVIPFLTVQENGTVEHARVRRSAPAGMEVAEGQIPRVTVGNGDVKTKAHALVRSVDAYTGVFDALLQ